MTDRDELNRLLEQSRKLVAAMTPEQKEEMMKAQRESWVRGEMNWPKSNFILTSEGVKIYDRYEDYLND